MDQQHTATNPTNGASTTHDLFVLTDEQILEIEPEGEVNVAPGFSPASSSLQTQGNAAPAAISGLPARAGEARNPSASVATNESAQTRKDSSSPSAPRNDRTEQTAPDATARNHESPVTSHDSAEPPAWLAAQMNDPWTGADAKELWNGVQQSKQETAAYRAAFATPEEARALKELYPGGVNEARASANRARLLEQIDQSYYGASGSTPEQTGAARAQLAALMLREDPTAFREMVFAGLRALEAAEKGTGPVPSACNLPRLAQIFAANRPDPQSAVGATLGSPATGGASPAPTPPFAVAAGFSPPSDASLVAARHAVPASGNAPAESAHVAAYAAFEKAANEDLERSVGAAIERTLTQALPNLSRTEQGSVVGAQHAAPLQARLSAAVRQDVEAALKGDRQLSEQIAQILSARRFDNETRAQVVRLIDDRARQLVPSAAKRVINDWTHATLAAHRGSAAHADAATARREVLPVNTEAGRASLPASSPQRPPAPQNRPTAGSARPDARRVDYRKLSDEQILEM